MKDLEARRHLRSFETFMPFELAAGAPTIHGRFEQQAARRPDAVAIALSSGDVSYAQLNAAANRRARHLSAVLSPEDRRPVALLLDQGFQSIAWTLAILKAGLAYAPLDQRLPLPALRAMAEDLAPGALVAAAPYLDLARTLAIGKVPVIDAEPGLSIDDAASTGNPGGQIAPDAIAYVFYTSGSTGRPKGVADAHVNVLHNVRRYTNTLRFAAGDRLSLVQNPSFSGTVSTLFGALLNGASVVPFDLRGDGLSCLSDGVRRARVTVFHSVPAIFRELSDPVARFPDVRLVRLEGDRAGARDVRHFHEHFQDHCTLVNGLGATECGLVRQFFVGARSSADLAEAVPIGYPVPDVAVKIVDDEGRDLPFDTPGEIVVESRFLATGYWRNPHLTADRFLQLGDGLRRYRTGDLGTLRADGCLVHLGRTDHRVRVAGAFIDTGEIERLLHAVDGVAQAVVHDFVDRTQERRLCAYVVRSAASMITADRLREAIAGRVGAEAMPGAFVFLDALPLTSDGKVDRKRLPAPGRARPELGNEYVAPLTPLERQMAQVWSEILEIDRVGVTDSLFALGGDSLRAARIVNRLASTCGDALRITSLFEHPTIRALAQAVAGGSPETARSEAALSGQPDHAIAVIGMAARFPGADDIDELWNNLRAARESITFFGAEDVDGGENPAGAGVVLARGLLNDVDGFDARLFGLTSMQAQMLDPQQRVWLECVHRAMEDAGLPAGGTEERAGANVGVFVGGRESSYLWHLVGGNREAVDALLNGSTEDALELVNSNDRDSLATRTSFLFGFTGPSVNVQTACSTSLVAVAQACQALASGQCDAAIAGGVAITFPQKRGHRHLAGGMYSRDGHCRTFDADASGTVFSDGAGAVVLKRLDRARADGDRIEAVIRGWAINNDGSQKASFTAPSVEGQARVIRQAHEHAGVEPGEIGYVEAHGTATPVGDPIEFAALDRVFGRGGAPGVCGLGSVKSNIGHTDTAAGIAGLIKTILALAHGELPATLHYQRPNPEIDLAKSAFYVVDRLRPWTTTGGSRIAGVTSLGVGGTNCHVVVEEAPAAGLWDVATRPSYLVPLSAASSDALDALEASYRRFAAAGAGTSLARVAATAQKHRAHHGFRAALQCATLQDLASGSRRWHGRKPAGREPRIAFVFASEGHQYAGMGRELFETCPAFRERLQQCERHLGAQGKRPLLEVMFDDAEPANDARQLGAAPLFALEYSLAELLRSWGISPRLLIGRGIGGRVAACVEGKLSLEQGLALAAEQAPASREDSSVGGAGRDGCDLFVEIGSSGTLGDAARESGAGEVVATLRRGVHEWDAMLETIARLYVGGARIDWTALQEGRITTPVRLPPYPFQRSRHWYAGPLVTAAAGAGSVPERRHPLLGKRLRLPGATEIRFESRFSQTSPQFLGDHRLFGVSLPPAASHLSMLAEAATTLERSPRGGVFRFESLQLLRPLLLPDGSERDVQLICRREADEWRVELTSAPAADAAPSAEWTTHMIGRGASASDVRASAEPWDVASIRAGAGRQLSGREFYSRIWANHGGTGSSFRWIETVWQGDRVALCRARCPVNVTDRSAYRLHPGLIEAACQVLHCCGDIESDETIAAGVTYVPFSIDGFTLTATALTEDDAWCHARLRELSRENVVADLAILTSGGRVLATLDGFCSRPITREAVLAAPAAAKHRPAAGAGTASRAGAAASPAAALSVEQMTRYLQRKCAEIAGRDEGEIAADAEFTELGLDSLAALRLSNQLQRDFGRTIALRLILTSKSLAGLAGEICR